MVIMEDINISIIKNNQHYIKTPFKGKVINLLPNLGQNISENEKVAVLKTDKFYFEVESEYPGIVSEINCNKDELLDKWDTIIVVDVKENYDQIKNLKDFNIDVNSKDYDMIFKFQQEVLPEYFYSRKDSFLDEMTNDENLIFNLINYIYDRKNMIVPFDSDDLDVSFEVIGGDVLIIVGWPDFKSPLLALRSYFLINEKSNGFQYFTCERSLENEMMISSVVEFNDSLTRYNYGLAPKDINLEKQRIIDIFQ